MGFELTFQVMPVVGVLLVIVGYFVPQFQELAQDKKQWITLGLVFVVPAVVALLSFVGLTDVYQGPTLKEWIWFPLVDFGWGVLAMTGAYKSTNYIGAKFRKE